jgi:hypothetical protein
MKRIVLFLGVISVILFAFFAVLHTNKKISACEEQWTDTSSCIASECGCTHGTKTQALYKEVCDNNCPTVAFSTSHQVIDVNGYYVYADKIQDKPGYYTCNEGWTLYDVNHCKKYYSGHWHYDDADWHEATYACPSGYSNNPGHSNCRKYIETTYKTETFTVNVPYGEKSEDKNHCHKPTPESLNVPQWARGEYGKLASELDATSSNCHQEQIDTRTVDCDNAEIIDCGITPSITPEVTPTPTNTPSNEDNRGGNGGASAPVCNDIVPASPRILSVTASGANSIKITWTKVDRANSYAILYGSKSGDYLYSVFSTGDADNYIINGISNGCFTIKAVNGCMPGPLSSEFCTGTGTGGEVLGASTLGTTGGFTDGVNNLAMSLGLILTGLGLIKLPLKRI